MVAEKCPRQDRPNQNEPTGMISSRLNAGFKFVSESVIDSASDPAHKLFHERTVGGCARLTGSPVCACAALSTYTSRAPSQPLALPRWPLSHSPTPHSGVSTCGSLATAAVAGYQAWWLHSLLQQSMPVSLGAFVCLHSIIPKSQKRRGCRCQSWGERERHATIKLINQLSLGFPFSHFFLSVQSLHQQVCYSSSTGFILDCIIHLSYCNIFLSLGGIRRQAHQDAFNNSSPPHLGHAGCGQRPGRYRQGGR